LEAIQEAMTSFSLLPIEEYDRSLFKANNNDFLKCRARRKDSIYSNTGSNMSKLSYDQGTFWRIARLHLKTLIAEEVLPRRKSLWLYCGDRNIRGRVTRH
jgi:hypothetical protein